MATEDRHASDTKPVPTLEGGDAPAVPTSGLSAKGAKRRRLAKAGAGATGVVLTLYSQPGMACSYCGITPSAAMSAIGKNQTVATVSHHGAAPVCSGLPPAHWCSISSWPRGCNPNDYFHNHFTCSRGSAYYKTSCKAILSGAPCDPSQMAKYIMAAHLNVLSGRVNFLTVETLQSVWNEWVAKGYYEPMAGQRWFANEIVAYLYGTMD